MALDFPASPSLNQTYSGPGGVVWVWDGAKWVSGTGSTVYAPVTSPVFQGDPRAPNPPAGDADTSVATTSFVAAAVGTALHDVGRNAVHNSLMAVAQRGAGPWTTGVFTMDRWQIVVSLDAISVSQAALTDAHRAAIGDEEARYCLASTVTGNAGAASYSAVIQRIENVRRLAGKTVTISFWAVAAPSLKLGVAVAQLFGTGGSPSTAVSVNGQSVTVATTFARYSVTFTVPSAAGKTFGTNGDDSTQLAFYFSCGATNAVAAGSPGVQSGSISIWGVQLEIGSVATPLEKIDPRMDLANCQRFFYIYTGIQVYQYGAAGSGVSAGFALPVQMRAVPTPAFGAVTYVNASGAAVLVNTGAYFGWQWIITATGSGAATIMVSLSAEL